MIVCTASTDQICVRRFMMERSTLKNNGENNDPACRRHHRNTNENNTSCGGPACNTQSAILYSANRIMKSSGKERLT
jgi:hypothetical protein